MRDVTTMSDADLALEVSLHSAEFLADMTREQEGYWLALLAECNRRDLWDMVAKAQQQRASLR